MTFVGSFQGKWSPGNFSFTNKFCVEVFVMHFYCRGTTKVSSEVLITGSSLKVLHTSDRWIDPYNTYNNYKCQKEAD